MIAADTASELTIEQAAVLEAALENAALGRAVLPLHGIDADGRCTCGRSDCASPGKHPRTAHGCKDATTDELKIRLNWRRWPDANVGIATGVVSDLVVIDIDPRHGGLESARELAARYGAPPATMEVATGGGGLHLYFEHPGGKVPNSTSKIASGIDVRGDGGFVVAPPSLHVSGKRYTWREQCPDKPQPMPEWLINLVRQDKGGRETEMIRLDNGEHWLAQALERAREGNRNEVGLWLACQLRDNGVGESEARGVMLQYAARCPAGSSPYTPAEALATLNSAYSTPAREPARAKHNNAAAPDAEHPPFTEYGNAQRLVREHGDRLRYSPNRGAWLCWDGKRFGPDETGNAERYAKRIARNFWKIAMNTADPIRREDIIKHAIRAEKNAGIEAMLRLARTEPGIAVTSADLDTDPFLLNVLNGTIDLRTGELRPHRQSDLITKLAPVEYRPDALAPLWERFLDRIMAGNREMIAYLARIAGLCLTGAISEQELYLFWGGGANGKNVFYDTLMGLLGDYAGIAPLNTHAAAKKRRIS